MTPLLDPLEAVKPAATLLHPNVQGYRGLAASNRDAEQCLCRYDIGKKAMSKRVFATRTSSSKILSPPSRCIRLTSSRMPASCRRKAPAAPISGLVPRCRSRCASKSPRRSAKAWKILSSIPVTSAAASAAKATSWTCRCAISFAQERPAGEDGDGLCRGVYRRQSAPCRDRAGEDRREERRPAGRAPHGICLRQRRLRRVQAARIFSRPEGSGRALQYSQRLHQRENRLHQQNSLRPYARAGRSAGIFRQRIADGSDRAPLGHGPDRISGKKI